MDTIHASCVAIRGHAVLIQGPSGAGKSDLALRLIDRGAVLVSDDRTILRTHEGGLIASAPPTIAGRIEVRGVGIVDMPHLDGMPAALVVAIEPLPERFPDPLGRCVIEGVELPVVAIAALEPSAPIKVELALARVIGDSGRR
jgi:serine kinase of HPr protein (carbohydrate metabolism regulator)